MCGTGGGGSRQALLNLVCPDVELCPRLQQCPRGRSALLTKRRDGARAMWPPGAVPCSYPFQDATTCQPPSVPSRNQLLSFSEACRGCGCIKRCHTLGPVSAKGWHCRVRPSRQVTGFPIRTGTGIFTGHLQPFCQDLFS